MTTFGSITNKHIKLLNGLKEKSPVVARWDHVDLNWLLNRGLVRAERAYAPGGSLSGNHIWTLSQKGSAFLTDERAGR